MRIDNTGIVDVTKSNIGTEVKGSDTVGAGGAGAKTNALVKETPYSVTATTVEKALFSLESQLDKIKLDAQNIDVDAIKRQMAVISNTMMGADYEKMQQQGYSLNDTDPQTIVTVMDKIKLELAKGGMDISVFGDDLSMEQLEGMAVSTGQAQQLAADLKECQEGDITYLVGNELEPTIENLYWAQHSGSTQQSSSQYRSGVSGQAAQPELLADENLKKQVEQVITAAGLPVNETTLGYGELLLEHEIPLTAENISYVDKLSQLKLPLEKEQIEKAITEAVAEGRAPQEAYMLSGYSYGDRAIHAQEVVEQVQEGDIARAVEKNQPVTLAALAEVMVSQQTSQEVHTDTETGETETKENPAPVQEPEEGGFLTARRQLEELRLVMTAQANYHLLKQGISIETLELQELVEELKGLETAYYKDLLQQQGLEATPEQIAQFQETTEKTEALKNVPAYVLGTFELTTATIQELYQQGSEQKILLDRANEAYETMMTTPRADLGDNIQQAFQNIDAILEDLELENSPVNQRAVRILAYNQMEITENSINQIKAADQKVQNLFDNMKPAVVMELIRQGVNPLETDVVTLNEKAEEIAQQLDPGQEEKYSKYLWELEQNQDITPQEKESYIGIFRLLRQIEKTDGAVIGALANQGGELSMKNLLSAVRTQRARGVDVTVDASFGGLEALEGSTMEITRQIEAAYQTDCAKEALQQLTPKAVEDTVKEETWQDLTPEQLLWQIKEQQAQAVQQEEIRSQEAYQRQESQLFSSNQNVEARVLQMLADYEMPMDTYHIMAANQMVNNRNSIFRKLFDSPITEESPDLQQVKADILEEFAEAIKTPEDMAKAQQALAEAAEHIMDTMINQENITSMEARDLKVLRQEIQLSTAMSKEETYAIPVLIADEMTNVQLKIVRGKEKRGMVDILFETEKLGKVAARIEVTSGKTQGLVAASSQDTTEKLMEMQQLLLEQMSQQLSEEPSEAMTLHVVHEESLDLTEFSQTLQTREQIPERQSEEYQIQTSQLYQLAKTFIEAVKGLE